MTKFRLLATLMALLTLGVLAGCSKSDDASVPPTGSTPPVNPGPAMGGAPAAGTPGGIPNSPNIPAGYRQEMNRGGGGR